jgi:hypothetical protein
MENILDQELSKQRLSFIQNNEDYNFVPESWQHINSLNIKKITFLKENFYMKFIVLPIVYVLTLGLFPLFLYWYTNFYVTCMFDKISEKEFSRMVGQIHSKKLKIQ